MKQILRELRKTMLRTSALGKDGNLQSCFSSLEILWTLYEYFLPVSSADLQNGNRNRFVLSKGQSTLAQMVVLAEKGLLKKTELELFCKLDSRISMQADRTKFGAFIETSAGSLGHGLPMAAGLAWGKKIKKQDGRVYCLVGDGEMNEGTMWEAMLFAASENLNNLTIIVDYNHSVERMIDVGDLGNKFESFGFAVSKVNGHDISSLRAVLSKTADRPQVILAETKRGWGSNTLLNDPSWFHRYPNQEELDSLLKEVDTF